MSHVQYNAPAQLAFSYLFITRLSKLYSFEHKNGFSEINFLYPFLHNPP